MADDGPLDPLFERIADLASAIEPGQRRKVARGIGNDLRSSMRRRLRDNIKPDGEPMIARKVKSGGLRPKRLRDTKPEPIRARSKRMFLKAGKRLKVDASPDGVSMGFRGRDARVMGVHQYGGQDNVGGSGSPKADYPAREPMGLSKEDRERILERVFTSLGEP